MGRKPKKAETKRESKKAKTATPYVENIIATKVEEFGNGNYYVQTPETYFYLSKKMTGGDMPEAGKEIVIFNAAFTPHEPKTKRIVAIAFNDLLHIVGDIDALDKATLKALNSKIIEMRDPDAIAQRAHAALAAPAARTAKAAVQQR